MANPDEFLRLGSALFRVEEEGAWIQLDLAHERIHLGQIWTASSSTTALANGGTVTLTLTADDIQPHMEFNVAAGGNSWMKIYEGGTLAGGVTLTPYNRNRGISDTPASSINYGGTVTGGTLIYTSYIPGGSGPQKAGGILRSENEIIGNTSTVYNVDIVNISGGTSNVSMEVDWYEVSEV